jgi:nucleoside permease NupC
MIYGIPMDKLTAPALLGLAIAMILMGLLVPRRTHKDKIEECERWHQAYESEKEINTTNNAQVTQLLELAKTTNALMIAFFGTVEKRKSGDANVAS